METQIDSVPHLVVVCDCAQAVGDTQNGGVLQGLPANDLLRPTATDAWGRGDKDEAVTECRVSRLLVISLLEF